MTDTAPIICSITRKRAASRSWFEPSAVHRLLLLAQFLPQGAAVRLRLVVRLRQQVAAVVARLRVLVLQQVAHRQQQVAVAVQVAVRPLAVVVVGLRLLLQHQGALALLAMCPSNR